MASAIDDALVTVFGADTIEYQRYRGIADLDTADFNLLNPTPLREIIEGLHRGKERTAGALQQIISLFGEKLQDLGEDPVTRARTTFNGLDLHTAIQAASAKQFADGHFADAVRNACVALNGQVQAASGRYDKDGTDLMQYVFSPGKPTLAFNDLNDDTDRSEQQGMMFLYAGAMLALRNPPSHKIITYEPERAVEAIALVSFLAKQLSRAKKAR